VAFDSGQRDHPSCGIDLMATPDREAAVATEHR